MTYLDSAEGITISRERAIQELDRHGLPDTEREAFFADIGDCVEYSAESVLHWLGY